MTRPPMIKTKPTRISEFRDSRKRGYRAIEMLSLAEAENISGKQNENDNGEQVFDEQANPRRFVP